MRWVGQLRSCSLTRRKPHQHAANTCTDDLACLCRSRTTGLAVLAALLCLCTGAAWATSYPASGGVPANLQALMDRVAAMEAQLANAVTCYDDACYVPGGQDLWIGDLYLGQCGSSSDSSYAYLGFFHSSIDEAANYPAYRQARSACIIHQGGPHHWQAALS